MNEELRARLMDLASSGAVATSSEWVMHFQEAFEYIAVISGNNPDRLDVVAARPDVKYMLEQAAAAAKESAVELVDQAWGAGVDFAKTDGGSEPDTDRLDVLHKDLDRIEVDVVTNVLEAVENPDKSVDKELAKTATRSGMVAEAAAKEGFWASLLKAFRGVPMRWLTHSAEPCGTCRWLDGQIVAFGREFPWRRGPLRLKTHGLLVAPPLHPACRCSLERVQPS